MKSKEYFMQRALKESLKAREKMEVPVGCVIVKDDKIIARGYNRRESLQDSTRHAEIIAIEKACKKLKSWRLESCDIYVTLEPCVMCLGAIINARIENIYFGAYDLKTGCCKSNTNILNESFNHQTKAYGGFLELDCQKILKEFFKELRK